MYKVSISNSAQKDIRRIPTNYYNAIVKRIFALSETPRPFGCVKLSDSENAYRIRVGIYRIIYTIEDNILTVEVIKVDHRKDVYR